MHDPQTRASMKIIALRKYNYNEIYTYHQDNLYEVEIIFP
jgi:hypothetical protein